MTALLIFCFGVLLLLCLGALVGASWADQALGARYDRVARERRELNEWRLALQEIDQHCVWCGSSAALPASDYSGLDDQLSAVTSGAHYPQGQFTQIAV